MKPRIVLTVSRKWAAPRIDPYRIALSDAGAEVAVLAAGDAHPRDYHGLCLPGGADVQPARYGEEPHASTKSEPERDAFELDMLTRTLAAKKPVLAICRGLQLLNVAFGGTLIQHLDGHKPPEGEVVRHVVHPAAGCRLARACGDEPLEVNSRHHQAVKTVGRDLRVTARAGEIVEGLEAADEPFVVAVQWHPEDAKKDRVDLRSLRLFDALVAAA